MCVFIHSFFPSSSHDSKGVDKKVGCFFTLKTIGCDVTKSKLTFDDYQDNVERGKKHLYPTVIYKLQVSGTLGFRRDSKTWEFLLTIIMLGNLYSN